MKRCYLLDPLGNLSLLSLIVFFGPKILIAAICGIIIGIERESKHKSAGITTMTLMSISSALFVATSILLANQQAITHPIGGAVYDPARVISSLIGGIGFIGGGVIFKTNDKISGITTASLILTSTGIGVLAGSGAGVFCILLSLLVVAMVFLIKKIEKKFLRNNNTEKS